MASWPDEYQNPCSEAVKQFTEDHKDSVGYHIYLQFLAEEQMSEACKLSQILGMKIGICNDLPVGATPYGFDTWTNRPGLCPKASIGAPPDELSLTGQVWGSFPLDQIYLKESGYQPVIKLFRDNMQIGDAFNIEHLKNLPHPWLIIDDAHVNVLNTLSFFREFMREGDYFIKEIPAVLAQLSIMPNI